MKKTLAIILALALVFSSFTVAFAEEAIGTEAKAVETLGMLKGDGSGVTATYLAKTSTRIQAAIMYLRLKGLEKTALEFTGKENFSDLTKSEANNKVMAYLKANPQYGFLGVGNNKFAAEEAITAQQYYKVILEGLGYKQTTTDVVGDFEYKDTLAFAAKLGLSKAAAAKTFTNNDIAIATVEGLQAKVKAGDKTLAETLIDAKVFTVEQAIAAGVYTAPVAAALDIKSSVAINSKVIEVKLNTAVTAVDAKNITVKDAAGTEVVVAGAQLAAYDTTGKTVLVTLSADLTSGTAYSIASGTTTVKFGGRAVDTGKPAIVANGITSTAYNQITITFDEPVTFEGATFTVAEAYGTKAELKVNNVKYSGSTAILLETADQKGQTLYTIDVAGVKDFAGNTMDKVTGKTFVGTEKSTAVLKVEAATANEPEEVTIRFNEDVDVATLTPENIKIEETYGTKATLAATAVRIGVKTSDVAIDNTTALTTATAKRHVFVTVPGLKNQTLYKVTVTGVKTAYGKDMSTTAAETYTTFVGKAKPTEFSLTGAVAQSNTTFDLTFDQRLDAATAENITNYAIVEAMGAKAALAVTKAEVDGKVVTLTVAPMKVATLYKITVTNVKDAYGNTVKTSSDANIKTIPSKPVADKFKSVAAVVNSADNTILELTFASAVGTSATDVTHYFIDNGIGYPAKAVVDSTNKALVKLTIPKTVDGKTYKVTVTGLENADNVAMDTAGISTTFTGRGVDATRPTIEWVQVRDNQTVAIYFDRSATDNTVKGTGKIWTGLAGTNALYTGVITYSINGTTPSIDLAGGTDYAYQDPDNANVLLVRVAADDAFKAATVGSVLKFAGATTKVKNTTAIDVPPYTEDPTAPEIVNVQALDKKTLRVYFSQPIEDISDATNFAPGTFKISSSESSDVNVTTSSVAVAVSKIVYVDDLTYDLILDRDLDSTSTGVSNGMVYLRIATGGSTVLTTADTAKLQDQTQIVELKKDSSTKSYEARLFGVSSTAASTAINSDINIMMTNKRTIQIYWPTTMDTSDITNTGNFKIYTASSAGTELNAADKFKAESDVTSKITTLYLREDLATSPSGVYYMEFNTGINDASGLKSVQTSAGAVVRLQMAPASNDVAKPAISSVAVSDDKTKLTITMNEKVAFHTTITPSGALAIDSNAASFEDNMFPYADTAAETVLFTATDLLNVFGISAQFVDESSANAVLTGDIASVSRSANGKAFTVTFVKALKPSSNGYVTTENAGTALYMYNLNHIGSDRSSDAAKTAFGVTASSTFDITAPQILSVVGKDGATDTVVVTFNEPVSTSSIAGWTFKLADNTTAVTVSAVALDATGTIATFTVTGTTTIIADGALIYAYNSATGDVKDLASNALVTADTNAAVEAKVAALEAATAGTVDLSTDANYNAATTARAQADAAIATLPAGAAKTAFQGRVTTANTEITQADTLRLAITAANTSVSTAVGTVNPANVADAKTKLDAVTAAAVNATTDVAKGAYVTAKKAEVAAVLTLVVTGSNTPGATATVTATGNYITGTLTDFTGYTQSFDAGKASFVAGTGTYTYVADQAITVVTFTDTFWGKTDTVSITCATPNVTVAND